MTVLTVTAPVPAPGDVWLLVQPLARTVDVLLAAATGLLVALVVALWLLLLRVRDRHRWQVAYWHLAANARCELCGARTAAPEPAPVVPAPRRAGTRPTTTGGEL